MPAVTEERMCPNAIFVPPNFARHKAASRSAREIFQRHTDLIEPLSLDEAYLDVTKKQARAGDRDACRKDDPRTDP
jgi:DNA polymerase-4